MQTLYNDLDIKFSIGGIKFHALSVALEKFLRAIPSHSHSNNSYEIHYVPYGRGHVKIDGISYEIVPNTLYVTGPNIEHEQIPLKEDPMVEYRVYFNIERAKLLNNKKRPGNRFINTQSSKNNFINNENADSSFSVNEFYVDNVIAINEFDVNNNSAVREPIANSNCAVSEAGVNNSTIYSAGVKNRLDIIEDNIKIDNKRKIIDIKDNTNDFIQLFENTKIWFGQDTRNLHQIVQQLFYELENRYTGYLTQVETLLQQLIVQIIRNYESKSSKMQPSKQANLVDSKYLIIEECFLYEYRSLSLVTLSKRLGLSPRQTERLLKEHYDKTFLQKKSEAKMSAAAIMLMDKEKRITDIAMELGYSATEHFSNAFKKYYSESARNFRKRMHGQ